MHNIKEDLFFSNAEMSVGVIRMTACMDNTVHVEIKVVEFGNLINQFYIIYLLYYILYLNKQSSLIYFKDSIFLKFKYINEFGNSVYYPSIIYLYDIRTESETVV